MMTGWSANHPGRLGIGGGPVTVSDSRSRIAQWPSRSRLLGGRWPRALPRGLGRTVGDGLEARAGERLSPPRLCQPKARRGIDLAAPASGDVGVNVRGPARARGPALDGAQV